MPAIQKSVYSFLDYDATLGGPYGVIQLGAGNGNAAEGIVVERDDDKATKTIGADGSGMFNLKGDKSGRVTVNLLKTSPTNTKLSIAYNLETQDSNFYGQGVLTLRNKHTGELHVANGVGIARLPTSTNAVEGGGNAWVLLCLEIDSLF